MSPARAAPRHPNAPRDILEPGSLERPHDHDLERAVLGSMSLADEGAAERIALARAQLGPADFDLQRHQVVFTEILRLDAQGEVPDIRLLTTTMSARVDVVVALPQLLDFASVSHGAFASHVKTVRELAIRRRTIKEAQAAERAARDLTKPIDMAVRVGPSSVPRATQRKQGQDVFLPEVEPWHELVSGAELLKELAQVFRRFVVLPDHADVTLALWTLFTYCIDAMSVSPRLYLTSPGRECGKSRLLTVIGLLARRPQSSASLTPATIYRIVDAWAPTLLLDEFDNARLDDNPELKAILNAGHHRASAIVLRPVGDHHEVRVFSAWAAVALAGIGTLPDTVLSRSIVIRMRRRRRDETVERLREARAFAELEPLRRRCARWAVDHVEALRQADPPLPDQLGDRDWDNWEGLLAVAEAASGGWFDKATAAACSLSGVSAEDERPGIPLLADIREVFGQARQLATTEILKGLARLEDRPWAEWNRNPLRAITAIQVSRLLRPFGPSPVSIRDGERTARGYRAEDFQDAWSRYLVFQPVTPTHPNNDAGETGISTRDNVVGVTGRKNGPDPHEQRVVTGVLAQTPESGGTRPAGDDPAEQHPPCPRCGGPTHRRPGQGWECSRCPAESRRAAS